MERKVGDIVVIRSKVWYDINKSYDTVYIGREAFTKAMSQYCGTKMTIADIIEYSNEDGPEKIYYRMKEDEGRYHWLDYMFECTAKKYEEESLDLAKILRGCRTGFKLWSPIFGDVIFEGIDEKSMKFPILIRPVQEPHYTIGHLTKEGYFISQDNPNKVCLLFSSKDQRDWKKFNKLLYLDPIIEGTKVMFYDSDKNRWSLAYYSHNCNVWINKKEERTLFCDYIIPVSKFDFEDIDSNFDSKYNYGYKGRNNV